MRAIVVVEELYRALSRVKKCAAPLPSFDTRGQRRRARLPILLCVRVEVHASDLRLPCTDLRLADVVQIHARDVFEGAFCVPVRLLTSVARQLREVSGLVRLSTEPARIAAWGSDNDYAKDKEAADVLVLSCGTTRFRLIGFPATDYPVIDGIPRRQHNLDIESSSVETTTEA